MPPATKPDATTDYYALLGLQPNATDDEISKAYRKQALVHHPDRNPGKEEEAKSRFQDIQVAKDVLCDPAKRSAYDKERIKRGMMWQRRTTAAASSGPAPTAFRPSQSQRAPPRQNAGSARYADFTNSSRDSSPFPGTDARAKFDAFKAFENMRGTHRPTSPPKPSPTKSRPAPTAHKTRTRSDWDEGQYAEAPRVSRSQSTRTAPRKAGFDPYAEGGDDTSSRNTSAFYNVSRGERPQASFPRKADNLFYQANMHNAEQRSSPYGNGATNNTNSDDAFGGERQSTPYATQSGEKTYFSSAHFKRSASHATNLDNLSANPPKNSPTAGGGRYRSASPRARSPQPPPPEDTSPSSSEDEFQTDDRKEFQNAYYARRGSADPRAAARKATVRDDPEERPKFSMPKRQTTWNSHRDAANAQPRTHYFPPPPNPSTRPISTEQAPNGVQSPSSPNDSKPAFNFSMLSGSSSSSSPPKNPSSDSVNTQFSPSGWHGQFFGSSENLTSQPAHGPRPKSRPISSPKRPTPRRAHASPPHTPRGKVVAGDTSQETPKANIATNTQYEPPPLATKFSADQWNDTFKTPSFAMPPPPPPANRPMSTPRSRNGKRSTQAKARSESEEQRNSHVVIDDTGDEGDDEARSSGNNLETESDISRTASQSYSAMDIDSKTPPISRASSTNATGRPSPVDSTAASPAPSSATFPKPPPPATAFNMQPLNAAFPLPGATTGGLTDMKSDLSSTLPFESAAGTDSVAAPKPQRLDLPLPPKPPLPPGKVTAASLPVYMNQVAAYIREFHIFNGRMLAHLNARQSAMDQMTQNSATAASKGFVPMLNNGLGAPASEVNDTAASWSWMGAVGDGGYLRYMAWMEEDERVRIHWNVAWERHREALEKLGSVRKEMKGWAAARGGH